MVCQGQQRGVCCLLHVVQPFGGHAVAQQLVVCPAGKDCPRRLGWWRCKREFRLNVDRHHNLQHSFTNLDQLGGTRRRMRFHPPASGPVVGLVVVVHVAKQQAVLNPMDDEADVAADPHRPEVLVLCLVEFVEAQTRCGRIQLHVKGRRLHCLLLVACQTGEAVGEGIGDSKLHVLWLKAVYKSRSAYLLAQSYSGLKLVQRKAGWRWLEVRRFFLQTVSLPLVRSQRLQIQTHRQESQIVAALYPEWVHAL